MSGVRNKKWQACGEIFLNVRDHTAFGPDSLTILLESDDRCSKNAYNASVMSESAKHGQ
jgi:hypothetical protein